MQPRKCLPYWCERGDSNSHGFPHWNLNPARLPIPPHSRITRSGSHRLAADWRQHRLTALHNLLYNQKKWGGRWDLNPRPQESQSCALPTELRPPLIMARPAGFEPATLGLEGRCSIQMSYGRLFVPDGEEKIGRGSRIRTCDPLLPKQMRYQAALCPERFVHLPRGRESTRPALLRQRLSS